MTFKNIFTPVISIIFLFVTLGSFGKKKEKEVVAETVDSVNETELLHAFIEKSGERN